jgi:integrase
MSILVRSRNNGRTFELRIKHKLLAKPAYYTFPTEVQAYEFGSQAEGFLARGVIPEALAPVPKILFRNIDGAVAAYTKAIAVPASTANVLNAVVRDIGKATLQTLNYTWAEDWIRAQKLERCRTPGTIRHHVGALARCLDWVVNKYPTYLADNPLRRLPRGYSTYNEFERQTLAAQGVDAKIDIERDRRLANDEEVRIVAHLEQQISGTVDLKLQARYEGLLLTLLLALETAMRLREIYTLSWDQIELERQTIFLRKTKNGDNREVPLSTVACSLLQRPWKTLTGNGLLLPFWNGNRGAKALAEVTSRISGYFAEIFEAACCPDFVFHDTRHEATCRLVLRTQLDKEEISRITGHRDPRMLRRYMSLRGSELAAKLW